jgi:hypothetical protein
MPRVLPILTSILLMASAIPAMARVDVDINIAPPAPRVIEVPPPRRGYVWAPGYWSYNHGRHVWVDGRWLRERRGYHWQPEHWDQRNGRWHLERGHWER